MAAIRKAPLPEDEAELLVVTNDCKGIPMRAPDGEKKPKKKRLGKGEKNGIKRMACVAWGRDKKGGQYEYGGGYHE